MYKEGIAELEAVFNLLRIILYLFSPATLRAFHTVPLHAHASQVSQFFKGKNVPNRRLVLVWSLTKMKEH